MESRNLIKPMWFALSVVLLHLPLSFLSAQTSDTAASDANQSWSATTESQTANTNPTRTTESHKRSGNRTVDSQNVESLGPDGHYELYSATEKESVQVTPTTTRTILRTFGRDGSGQKILIQVTEEDRQSLPGGNEKVVRVTSNPNLDGRLQVVQREVAETKKTSPDVQETKTTVFLSDGSGGFVPSMQIQERQKTSSDHTVNLQKSTLLLDGAGNWQVNELKESTVKQNGKERTTDERISTLGPDGKLVVVSSSLGKESKTPSGEKRKTVETYSTEIPGSTPDGKLHLSQRVTTLNRSRADGGKQTEQQIEQPNPGDPSAGLGVTVKTLDTAQPGPSGIRETRTIQVRDATGSFGVVSVDNTKSDKRQITVDISPPEKPK
jgi:hypothetical protein